MRPALVAGTLVVAAVVVAGAARPAAAQRNDRCVDRNYVTFLPFTELQPVSGATLDPGEPAPACAADGFAHSVWYATPPPVDGVYAFSTCGSDFDTVLQIHDGAFCDTIERRDDLCNDDADLCGPGSRQSLVFFRKGRGPDNIVHAQVGSRGPAAGTLRFTMQLVPEARNDACVAARVIGHPVFREILDVARTSGGGDDPDPSFLSRCGAVGNVVVGDAPHSVWYRYTPARSGLVAVDTRGTTTPVVVAVFKERAEGCVRLGARAACAANRPAVFDALEGQPYLVWVGAPTGVDPDVLVFRLTGPSLPPVASAGPAQTVAPGTPVALDASASADADGDPITFAWTQRSGPPVALSDPASAAPAFTAPATAADTVLDFDLAVSDGAFVSRASVRVTVSASVADADRDGVPLPADRCPETPAGEAVDPEGCACVDRGHRTCPGSGCAPGRCDPLTAACLVEPAPLGTPCPDDGNLCTQDICDGAGSCAHPRVDCARECRPGRCDPATGACSGSPAAPGTRCADDGDPCTDDVCDATGTCGHGPAGSYTAVTCGIAGLRTRFADRHLCGRAGPRLERLLLDAHAAVADAEGADLVGDYARARRLLARALRLVETFSRQVARLETRRRIASPEAGLLLAGARAAAAELTAIRAALPGGRVRRASP
jgi:hypothetical protein